MTDVRCQECGTPVQAGAPDGLCPACLLRMAIEPQPDPLVTTPASTDGPSRAGEKVRYFGDYELLEEIARGGMGIVYRARQVSLNRIVAVKMMRPGLLASEIEVARFRAEAEAAASLQHPNIIAIHEVGEHDGLAYFSMDYVEGRSLAQIVREHPLPARKAAACVRAIAEAVHFAHLRGILHRDLKPANVIVDTADAPRIADFGLAKRLEGDASLTRTGALMGTPPYMPPEQAGGKRDLMGPASDVYSLGAILYELLTGRPPFQADTPMDTAMLVIHQEPVPPRVLNAGLHRDVETICLKCLAKDPRRRYPSAQALADDLGRFLAREPIHARPPTALERAALWCRRHPWRAAALAAVVLLALGATATVVTLRDRLWQSLVERARTERAAGNRAAALELLARAAGMRRTDVLRHEAIQTVTTPGASLRQQILFDGGVESVVTPPSSPVLTVVGRHIEVREERIPNGYAMRSESKVISETWDLRTGRREPAPSSDSPGTSTPPATPPWPAEALDDADAISSEDGRLAAVVKRREPNTVHIYEQLPTGIEHRTISLPSNRKIQVRHSAAFSPDGAFLAAFGGEANEGSVWVWNARTGAEVAALRRNHSPAWSDGGRVLVTRGPGPADWHPKTSKSSTFEGVLAMDNAVNVWELNPETPLELLSVRVGSLAFGADDGELLSNGVVWTLRSERERRAFGSHSGDDQALDTTVLETGNQLWLRLPAEGAMLKLAQLRPGRREVTLQDAGGAPNRYTDPKIVSVSPDGARAVVVAVVMTRTNGGGASSGDHVLELWDLSAARRLRVWTQEILKAQIQTARFSPDGRRIAVTVSTYPGSLVILDSVDGSVQRRIDSRGGVVAFSPDGRLIAAGGTATLALYDVDTGRTVKDWRTASPIAALAFAPDGKTLVSGGDDGAIGLWSVSTGQLASWEGHSTYLSALAFSRDGKTIASGAGNGTLKLWDLPAIRKGLAALGLDWPQF